MNTTLLNIFLSLSVGICIAQHPLKQELKNIRYPSQGNNHLKEEWTRSSGGIIESSQYTSDEYIIENKQAYSDSVLAHHHDLYQEHLSKKQAQEKNLLKEPELPGMPSFDSPDFDEPDIPKPGTIPPWILNVLLFIVVGLGLFLIFYLIIKNSSKSNAHFKKYDDYWNPEIVPKSDLEYRLEKALLKEKYREAVRIYFTLILKELIRLNYIKWTREKTNHEYLTALKNPDFRHSFQSCIHVFDVIWYGEYEIDKSRFSEVEPTLLTFLNTLKANE
ncbi:MAG: hypothetical protein ACKO4Y_03540 [Flavobacteriales bacterium]